jgi:hypothetical protein
VKDISQWPEKPDDVKANRFDTDSFIEPFKGSEEDS